MSQHDVIDNRNEKLVDNILTILPEADKAKFAVGYFFLSGFQALGSRLDNIKELRLLIGNTTNRRTVEQLAEGHKRLELVRKANEKLKHSRRTDREKRKENTAGNLRDSVGLMDQTDSGQNLVLSLVKMIEEERLKVRVYTRGRLHAKAYIFDWAGPNPGNEGIAIVGSSNLSLAGIEDNTELNVLVHDNGNPRRRGEGNHGKLSEWFGELWDESENFAPELMSELKESWAAKPATPYDVFMKTAYTLVGRRLEEEEEDTILWDDAITRDLADFQKRAVMTALWMMRRYGGCFISDVVGLGKSYIASAVVRHFRRTERCRPLIICPKPLVEMWQEYNARYDLTAEILPMSMLQAGERGVDVLDDPRYRDRDLVLIDESHNFRHHSTQRYEELSNFLGRGQKVCLVTATPRNTRAMDIYNQMKLFHPEEVTDLPVEPPNLREYFTQVEKGERRLEDLLTHVIVRRRRRDILRWYGRDEKTGEKLHRLSDDEFRPYLTGEKRAYVMVGGRHQFFPKRELKTLRYSIEETYKGLYQTIRSYLGRPDARTALPGRSLTYARYGLWHYVDEAKKAEKPYSDLQRAGINLRGLVRTMLFKRFESSVHAFRKTVGRMIETHEMFLRSLEGGFIPAGDDAEGLLGHAGRMDDEELLDTLQKVAGRYEASAFDTVRLKEHIEADIGLLKKIFDIVEPIRPSEDAKLQVLLEQLGQEPVNGEKCLIFTQYSDTAEYLYSNLNPDGKKEDIEVIYGTDKSKARVAGRFAPKANPELRPKKAGDEIRVLIATDVMSQGLNLQDCDIAINYDLHWNPVQLIQRFGRIDRIGSEHDVVWGLNFLPETALEVNLGIHAVLKGRIQDIHDTIGEDAVVLDETERLNENAMYAIYEEQKEKLPLFEDEEARRLIGISEVEALLRNMMEENPEEFKRIARLRDGIRSTMLSGKGGLFVHCKAGEYQQLYLADEKGKIISSDPSEILPVIWAEEDEPMAGAMPKDFNRRVMAVKQHFEDVVRHRRSQRRYSSSLLACQRYVLDELQELFRRSEDTEKKKQINLLVDIYQQTPSPPVRRRLNRAKNNGMTGDALLQELSAIYHEYKLSERQAELEEREAAFEVPQIVCSEALREDS